ncbi:MAG: phage head closure protein [Janthinobacterium lividum]
MNLGKLDRQVWLQQPITPAQNGYGEPAPVTYQDMALVWAEQKPGAGTETFIGQQLTPQQVVVWQIRHRTDVEKDWRLQYQGRTYEITLVTEIGRRVGLTLTTYTRG